MVVMPDSASRSAVLGPTPHNSPQGSGARKAASCPGGTTWMALGGPSPRARALPTLLAILATSLLAATPSEQGRCSSLRMAACKLRATVSASSGRSLTSRKASSMESCSTKGVRPRRMAITWRETALYAPWRVGTMIRWGQRRTAWLMGIAEWMPSRRAG